MTVGQSSVFIFELAVQTAKLIYAKRSNSCVHSLKYFEVKLILKTLFLYFFSNEGSLPALKKKF